MVPIAPTGLGTELMVSVDGSDIRPAAGVQKPFHDPKKGLPKSYRLTFNLER
jgi:hypothetical protein